MARRHASATPREQEAIVQLAKAQLPEVKGEGFDSSLVFEVDPALVQFEVNAATQLGS